NPAKVVTKTIKEIINPFLACLTLRKNRMPKTNIVGTDNRSKRKSNTINHIELSPFIIYRIIIPFVSVVVNEHTEYSKSKTHIDIKTRCGKLLHLLKLILIKYDSSSNIGQPSQSLPNLSEHFSDPVRRLA